MDESIILKVSIKQQQKTLSFVIKSNLNDVYNNFDRSLLL